MRRLVQRRAASSQFNDGHFSVGHNIITCGIRELFWRFWPVNFSASLGGPNEEKVGFNPVAFAVDVWVNTMGPFRASALAGSGDVMSCRSDPDVASVVVPLDLPHAEVMALGESIESLLKDEIGRLSLQEERGHGGIVVTSLAERCSGYLHRRFDVEIVGLKPASPAK